MIHEGAPSSPVILHVPHASTTIPADVRRGILLDDAALDLELLRMTDAYTDGIAATATADAEETPWRFVNGLSRLVIDPERFPDAREEMLAAGMGAVYTQTSGGMTLRASDALADAGLIARYFTPYASALARLVDERINACGGATIIDVHSFPSVALPYELHSDLDRPEICIGRDDTHTPPRLVDAAVEAFSGFGRVGINEPFIGTYVPLAHYGTDLRVRSIMLEVRRNLYMDESSGAPVEGALRALGAALARLIDCDTE
jgi:N-formylglutamate amidohydrolase